MMELLGLALLLVGAFFELVGALGVLRFSNFYSRIHAVTVTVFGGTVTPLIGLALILLSRPDLGEGRVYLALICIASSIIILLVAPTGSHALLRAVLLRELVTGGKR